MLAFCDEAFNDSPRLAEGHEASGQADQQQRARVSDASMNSIIEFAPVRGSGSEFVLDE